MTIAHAHWDHVGGLPGLKRSIGAAVYAHHRHESAVIRGQAHVLRPPVHGMARILTAIMREQPICIAVDRELSDGDRLDQVLPGLQVIDSPGHSPGSWSLRQPAQRALFCGDAMRRRRTGLNLPPAPTTRKRPFLWMIRHAYPGIVRCYREAHDWDG